MFYYKKEKELYYIWADAIKWKFWPFKWIFVKNKYFWEIEKDFDKYPAYKYSVWVSKDKVFVVWSKWVVEILNK